VNSYTIPKGEAGQAAIAKLTRAIGLLSPQRAWRVEICEDRLTRSVQQCRFLNGVLYKLLSDATGYERDDISEYCCGLMWGWRDKRVPKTPRNPSGVESVPIRTTTTNENGVRDVLKWDDFSDYVAFLQRHFAQECGIVLPDPDQNWRDM
jgi:hypothetical protein